MNAKKPSDSVAIMSQLVLPPVTNCFNNLMGGDLLRMLDIVASICAKRHSENNVVTVSVDGVSFKTPVPSGSVLTIEGKITRAFNTSMEIRLEVKVEIGKTATAITTNEAYYSFVALDDDMKPVSVPPVLPQTEDEHYQYNLALERREFRLKMLKNKGPL